MKSKISPYRQQFSLPQRIIRQRTDSGQRRPQSPNLFRIRPPTPDRRKQIVQVQNQPKKQKKVKSSGKLSKRVVSILNNPSTLNIRVTECIRRPKKLHNPSIGSIYHQYVVKPPPIPVQEPVFTLKKKMGYQVAVDLWNYQMRPTWQQLKPQRLGKSEQRESQWIGMGVQWGEWFREQDRYFESSESQWDEQSWCFQPQDSSQEYV